MRCLQLNATGSFGVRFASVRPLVSCRVSVNLVFHGWDKDYTYLTLHLAPVDWTYGLPAVVLPH